MKQRRRSLLGGTGAVPQAAPARPGAAPSPSSPWIAQADDAGTHAPAPAADVERYAIGANATPFSPTGGLRMSAHDMGVVMLMLANGGRHAGRQLLEPATIALMFTPQWTHDGKAAGDANGGTSDGLFNCWGLGNQQFPDRPGMRLVEGGGFAGAGHLGDAYGLRSVFVVDLARKDGMVVLVGGSACDPAASKGRHCAMARFQEQALSALYRGAIAGSDSR